ncbi:hypothetical protein AALP_AA4G139000 [Arabis alpina]|uniref:Splicing factor Cactin n=1 Tax=Arabis alpina TaxID=50452 RepID=A0A087H356_ARAAL|nr:hypothetical protein AALP_AA4G139000 [Arabis alpina]
MDSHGKSKRDRHGRQKKHRDDESEYYTCDSDRSYDSSPPKSSSENKRFSSKEISEEEIKEYMAKKAQKKALSVAKKLNLKTFVWQKKIEKDIHQGASLDEYSKKAKKRRYRENLVEVEKIKKRKEESAMKKARHEEDIALLARERARAEFQDWEKKEEEFYFDQSKVRSKIRLREGRAKPIDVLYHQLDEPYNFLKGLTLEDMEELRDDIKIYLDLDRTRVEYWEALTVVCDWELAEARRVSVGEEERGLHASVEADVIELLDGKTYTELVQLQMYIESQMRSGLAKVVEYWEAVLKRLDIYKAKACLKEIHAKMQRRHLEFNHGLGHVVQENEEEIDGMDLSYAEEEEEVDGSFSPELMHGYDLEETIDPEDDRKLLETERMVVLERQKKRLKEAIMVSKQRHVENNLELKAMKAMGAMEEGDAVFGSNAEVNLNSEVYRPRKPKYFNRVHTGYEWNKYNQTHYDQETPPPKTVQGYKFNIFYPDLIDKAKAPTCTIEKDGTSTETFIIRFSAGPPYEDIAFRIVNKEWEYSCKKGYKHTFEGGILHLYFNFKRQRYRR